MSLEQVADEINQHAKSQSATTDQASSSVGSDSSSDESLFGTAGTIDESEMGAERRASFEASTVLAGDATARNVVGPTGELQDPDQVGQAHEADRAAAEAEADSRARCDQCVAFFHFLDTNPSEVPKRVADDFCDPL